jgi:hypothetical protein
LRPLQNQCPVINFTTNAPLGPWDLASWSSVVSFRFDFKSKMASFLLRLAVAFSSLFLRTTGY